MRAHATRLLGEVGGNGVDALIRGRLSDESARVRYFAAQSLGKLRASEAVGGVVELLESNNNRDPIVRHGGIMGLSRIATAQKLCSLASHNSVAVRLAVVCALRRQEAVEVATFLEDDDPLVVLEAARAIHDVPIRGAFPQLAALVSRSSDDEALQRRVLNANFHLGGAANAQALAQFAVGDDVSSELRLEAIEMLGDWQNPNARDRVLGMWRPVGKRDNRPAVDALRSIVAQLTSSDSRVRLAVARIAGGLDIAEAAPVLASLIGDKSVRPDQRAEALRAAASMSGADSLGMIRQALTDDAAIVRAAGLELLSKFDPVGAVPLLEKFALNGEPLERQAAVVSLGQLDSDRAVDTLAQLMSKLVKGELAPEVHLETLSAARRRDNEQLRQLVAQYEASLDSTRPLDRYRTALHGGDVARGRQIFWERTSVSCVRCHKVSSRGGEVGPDLSRIGAEKDRAYLLEALVDPNRAIAKGFESMMIEDEYGKAYVGVLKEETETEVILMDSDGRSTAIPKESIEFSSPSLSAMPADIHTQLTTMEIRDLVEYLATLTGGRRFRRRNSVP